jgi:hypothetical protein
MTEVETVESSIRHTVIDADRRRPDKLPASALLGSSTFATMVVNYTLSDVLGFASIGCWLCAQFP